MEDSRNTVNIDSGDPATESPRKTSPAPSWRTGTGMNPGAVEKHLPARRQGPREKKAVTMAKKSEGESLRDDILPRSQATNILACVD